MRDKKIVMLGDINIDTIWPVSEFPIPGHDGLVDDVKIEIGGAVVNSAIMLNNLQFPTTLLSRVGHDIWAEWIKRKLAGTLIDLTHLNHDEKIATGLTFVIVTDDGERTMFSHRGANVQFSSEDIDEQLIRNASILHISGYALMQKPQRNAVRCAVEIAKNNGVPISLDTGLEPALKIPECLRNLLSELTICISGPEEIAELLGSRSTEEAAELLITAGVKLAALKLGSKGSFLSNGREQFICPPFPVTAVDTTGAGDSFSAGILYSWAKGLSLPATAVLANALGALTASVYGAGFSVPDKKTVTEFLISQLKSSNLKLDEPINQVINAIQNICEVNIESE